jgi:class 3 adenylate cyclase
MKVKKPFLIALGFVTFIAFVIYSVVQYRNVLLDDLEEYTVNGENQVIVYAEICGRLAKAGRLEDAQEILDTAKRARHIDFYILQYKGAPLFVDAFDDNLEKFNRDYAERDVLRRGADVSFYSKAVDDETVLTVGINTNAGRHVTTMMAKMWKELAQDILVTLAIALAAAAYFFRDILKIFKMLRERGVRDFRNVRFSSREAEIIGKSLAGYEHEVGELDRKATTFGNQVLPSLRSEILSGKKPPYEFKCTMVRTDINNFSSIFHNHDNDKFMAVINSFFSDASHIIARYRGYVHEFVGDEIIFYFKDDDCPNSIVTALSAIRDINAVASRYDGVTVKEHGYHFTVKSSLAHGKVRFGHLVNGFTLAGSVLIETVRILSHVVEKDGNVACFDGLHLGLVEPYCDVSEYAQVSLKGFSGEKHLYRYSGHRKIEWLLANPTPKNLAALGFYRDDADLIKIMRQLRENGEGFSEDNQLRVIQVLRDVVVTRSGVELSSELVTWIETLAANVKPDRKYIESRVLSAACMLMINLVPQDNFSSTLERRLTRLLKNQNRRVVANILDVLTHFKSNGDADLVRDLLGHEDGRVAANALVYEGARGISTHVLKRLKKMMAAKSPLLVASGLYALGEIARHHRASDYVYYSSQVEFLALTYELPKFVSADDAMVRRQALVAARKCGEAKVLEQIRDIVTKSASDDLRAAAKEHLGLDLSNVLSIRRAG